MVSMANACFLCLLLSPVLSLLQATAKKTYIVHMNHNSKPHSYSTHSDWYQSLTSTSDAILYTYTTAFHGFAAYLEPEEAESLRNMDSVVNVFEDVLYSVQTTRTPHFLGLNSNFALAGGRKFQEIEQVTHDVIVGVLDTGIWPESKSFDDTGLPEIPKRWRGNCNSTLDFDHKFCNKKLIGANYFMEGHKKEAPRSKDIASPRDYDGHGTHTASTIAGSPVKNATLLGFARGTARGMAARARLAIYKVCWSSGCSGADILAGMERAVLDGVDILSVSIGMTSVEPLPYLHDPIALGALCAMLNGVLVSCSAGNDGPARSSVKNVAPWILTVGAGSIDRNFPAYALLGNKRRVTGVSLYKGPGMGRKPAKLVYLKGRNSYSNLCLPGTLEPAMVRGRVVICDIGVIIPEEKSLVVRKAGGFGMILVDSVAAKALDTNIFLVPAVTVAKKEGDLIKKYVKTEPNPTVLLSFGGTVVNVRPSPIVGSFSSRGPNPVTPQILKPDILAPGVNILAAWSEATSPSGLKEDNRVTKFNIISGTSMACPHASGIAALLKAAHPTWSLSAIRSALMTTAYSVDDTNSAIMDSATAASSNPWAYGSGHIDPKKALSPGLVYDLSTEDYITCMCTLNFPLSFLQAITENPNLNCSKKFSDLGELNYPSFSVLFGNKTVVKYTRELTNVEAAKSSYEVKVIRPANVAVRVKPSKLVFKKIGEKKRYEVKFAAKKNQKPMGGVAFGSIVWSNVKNQVSSPIAFTWT
ncbi:subtilisin-like protease SBT1.8 [Manihot esculenta]|uniref:Subtilisin-like protease n=2 Tax=Manihot esculenta TaxID=3983 RepID=A0A2C9VNF4_MANES|nr:subtilisin-like protease SBT1.8 [Manihot esculenta]XP_043813792.1 subtilisin-like protease SBT1.8 [Manihot esculenta]OAY46610.1 hypothetical protein MANES_06G013200v8 [Manihot esculenta]OAY46625.2 hypothetical protein MANES_06G013250v8 [Manihot esculenta]